jgi:hypothetical protein
MYLITHMYQKEKDSGFPLIGVLDCRSLAGAWTKAVAVPGFPAWINVLEMDVSVPDEMCQIG